MNTQYHQRIIDELKLTISSLRSNVSNGETLGGIKDDSHHQQIEQLLEKNMKLEQEVLSLKEVKNENDRTELRQVIFSFSFFHFLFVFCFLTIFLSIIYLSFLGNRP